MNGFVIAGSAVYLIGISSYLKDVLRGRGKPNRVTWFLWSAFPVYLVVQCSTIVLAILVGKAMKRSAINVSQGVSI